MSALIQNTPEWEEMRKNKIGASDAPVIMQVSPWVTPYQLWQKKLSLIENQENWAQSEGKRKEPLAKEAFEKETGLLVSPEVAFHPNIKWMMASLDGKDIEGKNIVEIKCPGKEDHEIALSGQVPDKYFPQLQHQLEVCQLEMAYYFSFTFEGTALVKVYRDDKYIKEMVKREGEFWECMQELVAPELTSRDYITNEDQEWIGLACQWRQVNEQMKSLEIKDKAIRARLISLTNGMNTQGGGVRLSKLMRKGNVDYSKIAEIKSVDLDSYRKPPIEYWKIS